MYNTGFCGGLEPCQLSCHFCSPDRQMDTQHAGELENGSPVEILNSRHTDENWTQRMMEGEILKRIKRTIDERENADEN